MITTMFGADDSQIQTLRSSGRIDPNAHGLASVDLGGISPLALVTLDAAVTGASVDEIRQAVLGSPLEVIDDGEQLLFAVRREFEGALRANADDALASRSGESWSQTDEMRLDGWRREQCETVVSELLALVASLPAEARLFTYLSV